MPLRRRRFSPLVLAKVGIKYGTKLFYTDFAPFFKKLRFVFCGIKTMRNKHHHRKVRYYLIQVIQQTAGA